MKGGDRGSLLRLSHTSKTDTAQAAAPRDRCRDSMYLIGRYVYAFQLNKHGPAHRALRSPASCRFLDPLWGGLSGALAFKLYQDRILPEERRLQALLQRGWNAKRSQSESTGEELDQETLALLADAAKAK